MRIVYKQFYLGKYKAETDDLYLVEYYLGKCTKYIMNVPLIRKSNLASNNEFVRSMMSEDMFELQPSPDYLNEYL